MSRACFDFRQFRLYQDRCAMKAGTDSVLLGAWLPAKNAKRALDIGTGTGILALMVAQRNAKACITAIDIDEEALAQARENVEASPFRERIEVFSGDATSFLSDPFDLIVCNPPFFEHALLPPDSRRGTARHTSSLPFEKLARCAARLLTAGGFFCVVLPAETADRFTHLCWENNLHLVRQTSVCTKPDKPPLRALLTYTTEYSAPRRDSLVLTDANGQQTTAYQELTAAFYLSKEENIRALHRK